MEPLEDRAEAEAAEDDQAPPLGSWARLYSAVLLTALLVMALIGVFSAWQY